MSSSIFRRFSSSARLGDLLVQAGILTPAQLQEAMRSSRSKKLQIGQVLVMSGYMTSRDLQIVLEAQSMLRDRTIDLNLAIQCIKVARKIGGNFSDVLEDYDATAAQRARTGKLGELLSEAGLVGEEDLSEAMERSVNTGMPLGRMLVLNRILPSEVLQKALEVQVRLRDEVVTREEAILELRHAAGLEGDPPKNIVEEKKKPIVRLGELLVMAGILNENDVMDALEWGLANQQPIGTVLVSQELITKELLDAALFFQNHVRDGKLDPLKACELLSECFSTGVTPEEALADAAPSLGRKEPKEPPISYQQLITMSRVVTDEQIEAAFDLTKQNAALIGKVLVLTGLMDVPTLQNTLRCFQMVAKGWLTPDDAIASLDYCLHQNQDMPMAFEQALRELKWNPDTGLKMRGEPGATESSTSVPAVSSSTSVSAVSSSTTVPKVKAEPAESKEEKLAPAAPVEKQEEEADSELTTEIKREEVNGSDDSDQTAVDQPAEKAAVASSLKADTEAETKSEAKAEATPEPSSTSSKESEPPKSAKSSKESKISALYDDADDMATWEDPTSLTAPEPDLAEPADAKAEAKADSKEETAPQATEETKLESKEVKTEVKEEANSVAKEEPTTSESKISEEAKAEPAKVEEEISKNGSSELADKVEKKEAETAKQEASVAEPVAAKAEKQAEVAKAEQKPAEKSLSTANAGGGGSSGPSLARALSSLYDEEEDDDSPKEAAETAPSAPADDKASGGLRRLLDGLIEQEEQASTSDPIELTQEKETEPVAESKAESKSEKPEKAEITEKTEVPEKVETSTEEKAEAKSTSESIAADGTAALEDSLDAIEIAAKTAQEAAELAAVEDVAAMSAEQLLVEIMKSAQNPNLKPATKRGGRFSETILPEDAKARQLAKLVGKEASKDLADKLAFDQGGEESPEAVDTAFGRLAETYFEQGNYKEAQVIYERMLVHRLNDLGPDNPLLVEDYNNLAMTLCVQGRFDKAEPFMKRAVHLYESSPKQDPVEHADYLHSLGTIQYKLEKHKDAEEIMLRVVSIRREALSEDHEDIGRALADYAKVLKKLGKDESAEAIYKKAREILKKHKDA